MRHWRKVNLVTRQTLSADTKWSNSQETCCFVDSSQRMASADRPAALLNPDCSAGSILLLPRPTTQGGQQKEVTFHFCLATQEGDTLHIRNFATNSPGVGKKCAWTSAHSKLPLAVPLPLPGLTFIFFLFSLFFTFYHFCHYSHYCAILHIKYCPSAYWHGSSDKS